MVDDELHCIGTCIRFQSMFHTFLFLYHIPTLKTIIRNEDQKVLNLKVAYLVCHIVVRRISLGCYKPVNGKHILEVYLWHLTTTNANPSSNGRNDAIRAHNRSMLSKLPLK